MQRAQSLMKPSSSPEAVPANPEDWSDASKRSGIYDNPPSEYRDHKYNCSSCLQSAVFTAEGQKQTYEVQKAYIWQRRTLCSNCLKARLEVEAELVAIRATWDSERQSLAHDRTFLERWLQLLDRHAHYGARRDLGNEQMLHKLLGRREA